MDKGNFFCLYFDNITYSEYHNIKDYTKSLHDKDNQNIINNQRILCMLKNKWGSWIFFLSNTEFLNITVVTLGSARLLSYYINTEFKTKIECYFFLAKVSLWWNLSQTSKVL